MLPACLPVYTWSKMMTSSINLPAVRASLNV
jgi:hypothetical protein